MENNTEVMQDTTPNTEVNSAPNTESEATPATPNVEGEKKDVPFIVRYKHQDKELTAEEAKNYAQKGLKYDDIAPMLDDLSYLATIKDKKPHELLKEFIANEERNYRESLIDRIGDDDEAIDALMEKYRSGNKSKFEKAQTDLKKAEEDAELREVQALEGRIANEFSELNQAFPEIKGIEDVPASVLKEAEKGKNLFDAYLRYQLAEQKKVDSAKQAAEINAKASAGNMSTVGESENAVVNAFLKGLRS